MFMWKMEKLTHGRIKLMKMRKTLFLITLVLSTLSKGAFSQTKEVLELESIKTSLIKKVASLNDSITKVEKKIEALKTKEILGGISDSTLRGFTIKGAKLKKAPDPQGEVSILFAEEKASFVPTNTHSQCRNPLTKHQNNNWIRQCFLFVKMIGQILNCLADSILFLVLFLKY